MPKFQYPLLIKQAIKLSNKTANTGDGKEVLERSLQGGFVAENRGLQSNKDTTKLRFYLEGISNLK